MKVESCYVTLEGMFNSPGLNIVSDYKANDVGKKWFNGYCTNVKLEKKKVLLITYVPSENMVYYELYDGPFHAQLDFMPKSPKRQERLDAWMKAYQLDTDVLSKATEELIAHSDQAEEKLKEKKKKEASKV